MAFDVPQNHRGRRLLGPRLFLALVIAVACVVATGAPPIAAQGPSKPVTPNGTARPTATPKPTATPTPPNPTLPIAIITDSQRTTFKGTNPYDSLAQQLTNLGVFTAWVVDEPKPCSICLLSNARVIIAGSVSGSTLTLRSVAVPGYKTIGSVPLTITNGQASPAPLGTNDLKTLLGHLTVNDSYQIVAAVPGFQPIVQLVPNPIQNGDPDYEPVLEHLLGENGIAAMRSSFTSAASVGTPDDGNTCSSGQRYLVYRLRFEQQPRKLAGHTRVTAYSEGYVLDCTLLGTASSATGASTTNVPTTSTLLTQLSALLSVAIAPNFAWKQIALSTNAFSTLVDVDPTSTAVRDTVAARSLRRLVGNLCVQLSSSRMAPSPTPTPSPTLPPPPPGPTPTNLLGQNAPQPQNQALPIGPFEGPSPIPLTCGAPLPDTSNTIVTPSDNAYDETLKRWLRTPVPTPSPPSQ
jgi:hypothetical protein